MIDSRWVATFKATGCLTPNVTSNVLNWWKSQSDAVVFGDMMAYCKYVRDGTASEGQHIQCCGAKDCTVRNCSLQDTWTYGRLTGYLSFYFEIAFVIDLLYEFVKVPITLQVGVLDVLNLLNLPSLLVDQILCHN